VRRSRTDALRQLEVDVQGLAAEVADLRDAVDKLAAAVAPKDGYHVDRGDGRSLCGALVPGIYVVDAAIRATCENCVALAKARRA
jgi:hypothetical protein